MVEVRGAESPKQRSDLQRLGAFLGCDVIEVSCVNGPELLTFYRDGARVDLTTRTMALSAPYFVVGEVTLVGLGETA